MQVLFTTLWFLCGILAAYAAYAADGGRMRPHTVWYIVLGPIILVGIILTLVADATDKRGKNDRYRT
jgi:hypothetical protein